MLQKNKGKLVSTILIFLIPFFILGIISLLLGKDVNWDLRNYHFYNPYAFLNNRINYDYFPSQIQTFLNPIMDIPIYFILRFFPDKLAGFIIGGLQGFNISLLILISYCFLPKNINKRSSIILLSLVFVGIFSPMFLSEIGTTFGDNITSIFVLVGILLIIKHERNYLNVFMSGVFFGISAGLKLTNLLYCISEILTILVITPKFLKLKIRTAFLSSIGILSGILLTSGYWMFLMFNKYQSPLFPFYNSLFKSPYWPARNSSDTRWPPKSFLEGVLYIFKWLSQSTSTVTAEIPFRDTRWLVIMILLTTLIIVFLKDFFVKDVKELINTKKSQTCKTNIFSENIFDFDNKSYIILFSLFSFSIWLISFGYHRYIVTLELLSGILIWCVVDKISLYLKIQLNYKINILMSLSFLVILTVIPPNWGRIAWNQYWFEVTTPQNIISSNKTIVVIISDHPISYVIPFFPKEFNFLRIQSNINYFISELELNDNLLFKRLRKTIGDHEGNIWILSPDLLEIIPQYDNLLTKYNLKINHNQCNSVVTNLEKLSICAASKV